MLELHIQVNFKSYFSFKLPLFQQWRADFHFPQQHMRNLARKGSTTKYVWLTDVDILPSNGLAKQLSEFLRNQDCNKCAYVIPPYELEFNQNFPKTKMELKRAVKNEHAHLYHSKAYKPNQHATNSEK